MSPQNACDKLALQSPFTRSHGIHHVANVAGLNSGTVIFWDIVFSMCLLAGGTKLNIAKGTYVNKKTQQRAAGSF